jgi:hypothetical protein
MRLVYKQDEADHTILTDGSGVHQVMMEWEKPYMEKCVQLLKPFGSVLEIGFGLGYSASEILRHDNVTSYTVVDCSPTVWDTFEDYKCKHPRRDIMSLQRGRWQDVLEICDEYDTIFFDDYCYEYDPTRGYEFLLTVLKSHTRIGSRIGFYSTARVTYETVSGIVGVCHEFDIDIPDRCRYAKGERMYAPIVTKISNDNTIIDATKVSPPQISRSMVTMIDYITEDNIDSVFDLLCLDKSKYTLNVQNVNLTCDHHSTIEYDKTNVWTGYVSQNKLTPVTCNLKFYMTSNGRGIHDETLTIPPDMTRDVTKWIGLSENTMVYRRLFLFRSAMFHSIHNAFGFDDTNCLKLLKITIAEK